MKEYKFNIEAFDSLVADAVRRENVKLLSLTDILIGGGSVVSGPPRS